MPYEVVDNGKNNLLSIEDHDCLGTLTVVFSGNNNRVVIGRGSYFDAGYVELNGECTFEAGDNNRFSRIHLYGLSRAEFLFGAGNGFTWDSFIAAHEPATIRFGDDCLVASGCNFTASDMHSIIDISTGRRINPPANIVIGDHVWLGEGVRVLKGARIGSGSIIGAGSIVTSNKPVPENVIAVGSPVKVVKQAVTWNHALIDWI